MNAASGSLIALFTIARAAGLAVLVTEALFLWSGRRELAVAAESAERAMPGQVQLVSRFFWAATPAVVLAGLALWSLASVAH